MCVPSEILFADGRSRLLTFSNHKRGEALKRLTHCIRRSVGPEILSHMNLSLKSQTEMWQNGQLSNQAYLLYLNDAGLSFFLLFSYPFIVIKNLRPVEFDLELVCNRKAGRTYRDLTQVCFRDFE